MTTRLTSPQESFDFIQDSKPAPAPSYPGCTWLRTTDFTEFVYDSGRGYWLEVGGENHQCTVSGPVGTGIGLGRFHEIVQDPDKSFRPYEDMLFYFSWSSSANNPSSNFGIAFYGSSGTVLATMGFGSGSERKLQDVMVAADTPFRIRAVEFFTTGFPVEPDNWNCGTHWKRVVQ